MKPIRVLLADDHALMRAGIRSLLRGAEGIEIVGEAADGRQALRLIEETRPDVVLMDIVMRELNGLDATARVVARYPNVRVIILSMNASAEYVLQALKAGAVGYLLKDNSPAELEQAVRTAAAGGSYLTAAVSRHVIAGYLQRGGGNGGSALARPTRRQREVLQLIAEGNTTKEIAKKLGIGVKTAETHRTQLMGTLDIHDVAGLVRYAIRTGVIAPDR
jgi:DNA-binding NarL/FixJ family response regulator